ncbi:hypothetical protein [Streptomyces winkii]|uniref:hypothetical protein n=1 Tax=Streptomyces winkii TaxID=3051178 RepID=UPI0028D42052|nr:hypothetical protein [Streptomyces sp. DSM 40971]
MATARARSRRSVSPAQPARQHSPPGAHATRLPWWAAALPVLAFVLLLALLLGGSEAGAAQRQAGGAGGEVIVAVLERVAQALLG